MLVENGELEGGVNLTKVNLNVKNSGNQQHYNSVTRNDSLRKSSVKGGPSSVNSQSSNNKVYYVEEKTKILEGIIIKVQPVVNELQRIIQEF